MRKILTNKFLLVMVLVAIFFFFGSITNTLSLNNRGIVVGLGLDYENEEVVVSCQTLVAGSAGADKVSNNTYAVTSASGRTLGEAIQKIVVDSAEYVSFAHCNSIIVGKSIADSGLLREVLEEMLLNSKIMENTSLIYYDGVAKDALSEKIAINLMTSFALQRMVASNKEYFDVAECSVKDYLSASLVDSGATVMPSISRGIDVEESSEESKEDSQKRILLAIRNSACLTRTGVAGLLNEEETVAYNMIKKSFNDGMLTVEIEGKSEGMEIESKSTSFEYLIEDVPTVNASVSLTFADMSYVNGYRRDPEIAQQVESSYAEKMKGVTESLYTRFAENGVDIFSIYHSFYARHGKGFKQSYPTYSKDFTFEVEYEVKVGE